MLLNSPAENKAAQAHVPAMRVPVLVNIKQVIGADRKSEFPGYLVR